MEKWWEGQLEPRSKLRIQGPELVGSRRGAEEAAELSAVSGSDNWMQGAQGSGVNDCREVELCPTLGSEKGVERSGPPSSDLMADDQRDGSCQTAANCFRRTAPLRDQFIKRGFPAPAGKGNSVQFMSGENGHLRGKYLQISINPILPLTPS